MKQVHISRAELEQLAWDNQEATIAFEPDRAILELGCVEYVADLTAVA